jgi:hypothetical protein
MAIPARSLPGMAALALGGLGSLLVGAAPAQAAIDSDRVMGLCLAGFNAAMAAARKTAPAGMGDFTCKCFLEQVSNNASLDQARETCRTRAASKFTVK